MLVGLEISYMSVVRLGSSSSGISSTQAADSLASERRRRALAPDGVSDGAYGVGRIDETEDIAGEDRAAVGRQRDPPAKPFYAQPMPLSLIVGPPNSGRAGEIVRRLRDASAREPVLIVPTGERRRAVRARAVCDAGRAALGISLRTFSWLFEDLCTRR